MLIQKIGSANPFDTDSDPGIVKESDLYDLPLERLPQELDAIGREFKDADPINRAHYAIHAVRLDSFGGTLVTNCKGYGHWFRAQFRGTNIPTRAGVVRH
ncbi:hypothetical protein EBZ39_07330 [bacterium]|nr:hypothetical protein [bacterium]